MAKISRNLRALADLFKAIGHPTRLAILRRVFDGPYCVSELQRSLGQTQPNLSQHLAVLRQRGLVVPERRGNLMCYRLADERVRDLLDTASGIVSGAREKPVLGAAQRARDR